MIGFSIFFSLFGVLIIAGCKTSRSGYESAGYRTVRSAGKFEVRNYSALTVVETTMAEGGKGTEGGFNRLFSYISGGNEAKQKISMTTPVFMSTSSSNATMAFVMPAKLALAGIPKPADSSLKVREIPPGIFAVFRFSGGRNAGNEADSLRHLQEWMASEGLSAKSGPLYAYFDPPWTPTFLRRNEVMIRTDSVKP